MIATYLADAQDIEERKARKPASSAAAPRMPALVQKLMGARAGGA